MYIVVWRKGKKTEHRVGILRWLLDRYAVREGSLQCDPNWFLYNVHLSRPEGAQWPPTCGIVRYCLLKPMCALNNLLLHCKMNRYLTKGQS